MTHQGKVDPAQHDGTRPDNIVGTLAEYIPDGVLSLRRFILTLHSCNFGRIFHSSGSVLECSLSIQGLPVHTTWRAGTFTVTVWSYKHICCIQGNSTLTLVAYLVKIVLVYQLHISSYHFFLLYRQTSLLLVLGSIMRDCKRSSCGSWMLPHL